MPAEATLHSQAARDIAIRSRSGVFAYPLTFGVIVMFTPLAREHAIFMTLIGTILFLATMVRGIACWCFDRLYQYNKVYWNVANTTSCIVLALAWGVLCMMSLYFYSWEWATMATWLSGAAFSAGVAATLSIDYRLTVSFLSFMILPSIIMGLVLNVATTLTATFLFSVYLAYLLHIARRIHKDYWEALRTDHLLKARVRELDVKNMELEALAYSISHDLRTPLRSLDGFSELLGEDAVDKLDEREKDYLARIRKSAQRMGELIDDLLQLSRISRAKYVENKVDLSQMVKKTFDELKRTNPDRRVEIEIEPDINVQGDTSMLSVAIHSLANNAWKYSAKRELSKIRFAKAYVNNELAYYMKDNGIGFDTRYKDKLFTPFQRLHHKNDYPGSGIGLAAVKRIMQRHGGRVWANGKVNKGATFYFTIEEDSTEAVED